MALSKKTCDLTELELKHLIETCDLHAPKINKMIIDFEKSTTNRRFQIQAFGKQLKDYAVSAGLTYEEVFHCTRVACNPENRMKLMLDPANAQKLLRKIAAKGFNLDEVILALANEIAPESRAETVKKNKNLVSKSGGLQAPFEEELLEIETVVCSHTTAVLRIVYYAAMHTIKMLQEEGLEDLCKDGRISQQRGFRKGTGHASACK